MILANPHLPPGVTQAQIDGPDDPPVAKLSHGKRVERMADHLSFYSLEIAEQLDATGDDAELLGVARKIRTELRDGAKGKR